MPNNNDTRPDKEKAEAEKMIRDQLSVFYSRGVPLVSIWMALSFLAKMKHQEASFTSPWTIMYVACLVVSFFVDMEMYVKFVTRQLMGRCIIAYLSTILRISAATALMLFFNTTNTVVVFLFFGLALLLVIYLFCHMLGTRRVPGVSWLDFKESLSRGFDMAALVVAPSVAGLSGKVLGYVEGSSDHPTAGAGGPTAVAPECFLFYSSVFGLLVALFCTVPPSLIYGSEIERVAKVYVTIAYVALLFLVVATVVAAEKILQEYVYLVCCAIAISALLLYWCDAEKAAGSSSSSGQPRKDEPSSRRALRSINDERRDEAKLSSYLFTTGISSSLLAIMAIHSSYGVGSGSAVSLGWSWKAFVGLAMCSILSHTVRIVILDQMTDQKRYENSRKIWTAGTFVAITCTAAFAVLVICLHPDEVKNIF